MTSLKYALKEFSKSYIISIILIIQIAVCTITVYSIISKISYFYEKSKVISALESGKKIYSLNLKNGEEVYIKRQCKDTDKVINHMKKFFNGNIAYTGVYDAQFKSFKRDNQFKRKFQFQSTILEQGYVNVNSIAVGETFFDTLDIKLSDGNVEDLYKNIDSYIPVILGNSYKKVFSMGSKIDGIDNNGKKIKYKVVGFLDANQYYTLNGNNFTPDLSENMNTFVILPEDKYNLDNDIASYIVAFNKGENNKEHILNSIINEGNKYDIQIEFYDGSNEVERYIKTVKHNISINVLFLIIILIFIIIGTVVVFSNKIALKTKEFGVHIMSGASLQDIALSIFIEFMLLSLFAITLSSVYLYFNTVTLNIVALEFNWIYFCITLISILIFMALLSFIPIRKILNINTSLLVRSGD